MAKEKSGADRSVSLDDESQPQVSSAPAAADEVALDVTANQHHASLSGRKVRLMLNEQEGEMGKAAVDIGYNGYPYQIPRNVEVTLPEEVFKTCIQGAKYEINEQTKDGLKTRIVNRFSYSLLGAA